MDRNKTDRGERVLIIWIKAKRMGFMVSVIDEVRLAGVKTFSIVTERM